jgi:hypothetical protein
MADTVAPTKNYKDALLSVSNSSIGSSSTPNVTDPITLGAINQGVIYVSYAQGTLTALNFIIEVSQDKSTWFQLPLLNVSAGTASSGVFTIPTYAAQYIMDASKSLAIPIPLAHAYLRLRVWGTGTPGSGDSVTISVGGGAI